jgi:hypothetical protein
MPINPEHGRPMSFRPTTPTIRPTTHDAQVEGYQQPYVPSGPVPADHWSRSPEWMAYRQQQAAENKDSYMPPPEPPAPPPVVEDVVAASQRARREWAEQEKRFEERRNPKPYVPDPALVQAEADLRVAVRAMSKFARMEAIIAMVRSTTAE